MTTVLLEIQGTCNTAASTSDIDCSLWNGTSYVVVGTMTFDTSLTWQQIDVSATLDTLDKINNARLSLEFNTNAARDTYIYMARLVVDGTNYYVNNYQQDYKGSFVYLTGASPYLHDHVGVSPNIEAIGTGGLDNTIIFFKFSTTPYIGGPYITIGTIDDYDPDDDGTNNTVGQINLPYDRISENLELIIERTITSLFIPWEWWIDYTGALQVAETRGSTKAITLSAANEIGGSLRESSSKQSAQRVRVIGSGEGAEQDVHTSDWYDDIPEMSTINSFYETIVGDKTITNKDIADKWAQVILAQSASLRQEVTVTLHDDPFTVTDFDVGDTITVNDSATQISGQYKIATIDKIVDSDSGETTVLTCVLRKGDITDRLADIYKTIQKLLTSSTYLDTLLGQGSQQRKIASEEVTDVWEQTSSNKYYTTLPDDEINIDAPIDYCNAPAPRTAIGYTCDKDEFEIHGVADNALGYVFLYEPLLKFSRDPRFTCEVEIDTNGGGEEWEDNDLVDVRIWELGGYPANVCDSPFGEHGFGFEIRKLGVYYILKGFIADGINPNTSVEIARLEIDTKYTLEARMEWKERVVKFYFGQTDIEESDPQYLLLQFKLRGILPVALTAYDQGNLCPFNVLLDAASQNTKPLLVIYRWITQAIRAI